MADDLDVTPGSGKTLRATEKSSKLVEHVIIDRGGTGATDPVDATHPLYVQPQPLTIVLVVASTGLTTATTAYTAGDVLGGEMSFTSAVNVSGGRATVQSAVLVDKAKITGACDLFLFDRASTPAADNAANSWADADMLNCQGVIQFGTPITSALNSVAVVPYVGLVVKPNATTLFGVLVTRAAHTFFGAAGDLQVTLGVLQDA